MMLFALPRRAADCGCHATGIHSNVQTTFYEFPAANTGGICHRMRSSHHSASFWSTSSFSRSLRGPRGTVLGRSPRQQSRAEAHPAANKTRNAYRNFVSVFTFFCFLVLLTFFRKPAMRSISSYMQSRRMCNT